MRSNTLSHSLKSFSQSLSRDHITVGDIAHHFQDRSIAFFLFLFALPAAIPLPGLGINLIIAAPLLLFTVQQMTLKQHIWLPRWMMDKRITTARVRSLTTTAMPWIMRAEHISKPRLHILTGAGAGPVIGLLGFIMALCVTIPLPLTNTVPSMGIAIMALGVIMKDGLAVLGGAVLGTLWIILVVGTFVFLGIEGLDLIKETIKSIV